MEHRARVSWISCVVDAFQSGETLRLAMLVYAAAFGMGSGAIAGLRLRRFILDRYPATALPTPDKAASIGLAIAAAVILLIPPL